MSDMGSWFIISTKPKQEFLAEKSLKSLGANVYLPLYQKKIKKNKEKKEVISPLFSGYLFGQFSVIELYHKVRYTRGVKSVLGNNDGSFIIWEFFEKYPLPSIKITFIDQYPVTTFKFFFTPDQCYNTLIVFSQSDIFDLFVINCPV